MVIVRFSNISCLNMASNYGPREHDAHAKNRGILYIPGSNGARAEIYAYNSKACCPGACYIYMWLP